MANLLTDNFVTKSGKKLDITFLTHGSLQFTFDEKVIYADPTSVLVDYTDFPKADYIFATHHHDDHFDLDALEILAKDGTVVVCTDEVAKIIGERADVVVKVLHNGDEAQLESDFAVKAVPAHNHPERYGFHPAGRDNGYIFNFDGLKVYVSGDTEDIDEMKDLAKEELYIAFLPVNQPYTMTIEQAEKAILEIRPQIFYPYHYGKTEVKTDIDLLYARLRHSPMEIRLRRME